MPAIQSKIRAAAAKNAALLLVLSETDHALPDLENQNRNITDLASQAAAAHSRIRTLDVRREKELREHETYRDSVVRRFAFKMSGRADRFAQRAAKEEQEYFAVLQEEHREKEMAKNLDAVLAEARTAQTDLEQKVERHRTAQAELDGLYETIFGGPTPGYPDEDAREADAEAALRDYQDARARAESEGSAVRVLADARKRMRDARESIEAALSASRMDMFGGGTFVDMMERNGIILFASLFLPLLTYTRR